MPWDVKLIDTAREIVLYMEQIKEHTKNIRFFLETLLFSHDFDIDSILQFYGIRLHSQHCLCVAEAADQRCSETIEANLRHLTASVRNISLSNRLAILSCSYVYCLLLIKELLGMDLSIALKNLELFNSILLYDYLLL